MQDRQDQSRTASLRDLGQLAELTFIVGVFYVFYGPPMGVLLGRTKNTRDALAGIVGLLFWAAVVWTFAGGVIP